MKKSEIVVLVPCHNEMNNFPKIYKKLKKYSLLVVNDFSTDGTKYFLKKNKIKHINTKKQEGQLNAIIIGFKYIITNFKNCKYVITFDADGEHKPSDLIKFINKAKLKPDIIMGARNRKNRFLESIISQLFYLKYKIKDPLTGFKMINKMLIKKNLRHLNNKYFFIDFLKRVSSEIKIINIDIASPKRRGYSKHESFITNLKIFYFLNFLF